jgi:hypothetical protein
MRAAAAAAAADAASAALADCAQSGKTSTNTQTHCSVKLRYHQVTANTARLHCTSALRKASQRRPGQWNPVVPHSRVHRWSTAKCSTATQRLRTRTQRTHYSSTRVRTRCCFTRACCATRASCKHQHEGRKRPPSVVKHCQRRNRQGHPHDIKKTTSGS